MRVWRVVREVYLVDHVFAGLPGIVGSYIIVGDGGEAAVVDPGPRSSVGHVLEFIESRGLIVSLVLLTHVHLDHSASVGEFVRRYGAKVVVHPRGARHIVDPSRLCEATRRLMRDVDIVGCPEGVNDEDVVVVDNGGFVSVGGRRVRVVYTPGHASHHQSFFLEDEGLLFAGDALGVFFCECVVPLTPPPTRPRMIVESGEKMLKLRPRVAALPHFGVHPDPQSLYREMVDRLYKWAEYEKFEDLLESDVCARRVYKCRGEAPYFGGEVERSWRGLREARREGLW